MVQGNGRIVAAELFRKGTKRQFEGGRTYVLTLGNAGGVTVDEDGFEVVPELGEGYPGELLVDILEQFLTEVDEDLERSPGWGKP